MKFHDQSILLNRSGSTHFILSVDRRWKGRPIQWPSQNLKQSKLLVQKRSVADLINKYFCVFIRSRSDSKKKFECLGKFKLLTNRSEHESCHENWLYNLRYSIYNYSLEIVDFEIEISYYDCFEGTFFIFPPNAKKAIGKFDLIPKSAIEVWLVGIDFGF